MREGCFAVDARVGRPWIEAAAGRSKTRRPVSMRAAIERDSHSPAVRGRGLVRPLDVALMMLAPLIVLYIAVWAGGLGSASIAVMNRAGPLWFITVLCLCCYRMVRRTVDTIWTPAFWLPAQSAIFFGFGPLVHVFGNEVTRRSLASSYLAVSPADLLWANLLSTVGVWCLLAGFWAHSRISRGAWRAALSLDGVQSRPVLPIPLVAILFVTAGGVLKYLVAMPAAWGMLDVVVPGFLTTMLPIVDVGFGIMAYLAARGDKRMRLLLALFLPVHVALSALTFSKNQIVYALLLPALGDFLARRKLLRFGCFTAGIVLVFALSQPFVHFGRDAIASRAGNISEANYVERATIAARYLVSSKGFEAARQDDRQSWWTRLDYSRVQVAARDLYLSGVPNDSLSGAWMYFIPRLVWPSKPVIVGPGWFFYERLTDREGTFLGLSIYGDLFWLGGWAALALGALATGWMFAMMTLKSVRVIRQREFLLFPLVLLALDAALHGPKNFFANGIIAVIPMYLAYLLVVKAVSSMFRRFLHSNSTPVNTQ